MSLNQMNVGEAARFLVAHYTSSLDWLWQS